MAVPLSAGQNSLAVLIAVTGIATIPSIAVVVLRSFASGAQLWWRVSTEAAIAGVFQIVGLVTLWTLNRLTPSSALVVMTTSIAAGALAYVGAARLFKGRKIEHDEVPTSQLLRFSAGAWLGAVSSVALTYVAQILMVPLASVEQLGIYALAINIASLLTLVTVSVRSVVLVDQSSSFNFDRLARHARYSLIVSLTLTAALAALVPTLIPVVFGEAFAAAILPTIILLPPLIVSASGSVATAGLLALGRPWLRSVALMSGLVLNVALIVLLVPPLGANGAALAMLASALPPFMSILFLRYYYDQRIKDYMMPRRGDVKKLVSAVSRRI